MPKDAFDDTEEEKKPKPEEEEEGKEVSTEADVNDDDGEPVEPGESADTRAEKKRNRYREAREEAKQAKETAAAFERQLQEERTARVAAQTAAQFYAVQQQQQQQQQQQYHDPWAETERHIKEKFQFILGETQRLRTENRLDEESTRRLQTEWIDNQTKQQELVAGKALWREQWRQQQLQPQQAEAQRFAAVEARLATDFPEVMNNQQAKAHAIGGWQMAMAAGKPNTWDTAREVMAATMRAFRLGRPPPIDETTRRRYSGVGGGSNGGAPSRTTFKMTKAHEKMAEGRYPSLPAEAAHKKWAQTVGRKILEDDA